MKEDFLTVGELAKKMGVTVRTLQYYDKENILKPSTYSEGGRRLYSKKDMVKLHQIISFKGLGFSLEEMKTHLFVLDTPEEVVNVLEFQKGVIEKQILAHQKALQHLELLQNEVKSIGSVDFSKYAEILEMIKMGNENYWVWKHFAPPLKEHITKRFGNDIAAANRMFDTYKSVLNEALSLQEQKEDPKSKKSFMLAEKWWGMVMDFTGGDLSLVPLLEQFNNEKNKWDNELSLQQEKIDVYLEEILRYYFEKLNGGGI